MTDRRKGIPESEFLLLAQQMRDSFQKIISKTASQHDDEFDRLRAKIEALGFKVKVYAHQNEQGNIYRIQLVIVPEDNSPSLH